MMQIQSFGHTEEKHVTSKRQLRKRLYGAGKKSVSSYFSQEDAEKMIKSILHKNSSRIQKWEKTSKERLVLYGVSQTPVGFGYFKEGEKVIFEENLRKACLVLKKNQDSIEILTSYLVKEENNEQNKEMVWA